MHSNIIFFFPKLKIIILFCNSTPVRIRVLVQTTTMMSSRASGSALLRRLGPRLLSVSSAKPAAPTEHWAGAFSARRYASATSPEKKKEEEKGDAVTTGENNKGVVSYWGVGQSKLVKEDGTEWRWNCFKPWDTYKANVEIDLKKHHETKKFQDKLAFWTVKVLRVPTDLFPKRKYGYRCMMLETIAAVPGMVGGMVLHLRSLRRFEHSGGWIRALLEEAENERMHLMTLMEVFKPHWYERTLVLAVQGVFFNAYFLGYLISPRFAHRVVGYLEEEAVHSYTLFLESIDGGLVENVPAPAIAIDYWRLPPDAKLRDALVVIRADEAHHRDVNHYASDIQYQGQQLREVPAPLDYH